MRLKPSGVWVIACDWRGDSHALNAHYAQKTPLFPCAASTYIDRSYVPGSFHVNCFAGVTTFLDSCALGNVVICHFRLSLYATIRLAPARTRGIFTAREFL